MVLSEITVTTVTVIRLVINLFGKIIINYPKHIKTENELLAALSLGYHIVKMTSNDRLCAYSYANLVVVEKFK